VLIDPEIGPLATAARVERRLNECSDLLVLS
jgi:hypothetical protein